MFFSDFQAGLKPIKLFCWCSLISFGLMSSSAFAVEYSGNVKVGKAAYNSLKTLICNKYKASSACDVRNIRVIGTWAWLEWELAEAGGNAIAFSNGKSWKLIGSGGGAMLPENAIEAGVPREIAEFLVPFLYANANDALEINELQNLSAWELGIFRNAIFARHGRKFANKRLQAYFMTWPWYHPNPQYSDALLTARDKTNLALLLQVEKQKGY